MNTLDKKYQDLLKDILENGVQKEDRTGTGTLSVFGRQIRHKMSEGFPLLTTKKMYFKGVITELLWFLRGETNIKYLIDHGCHIWDGDCYKRYFDAMNSDDYINIFVGPELRDEARKNKGNNGYTQKEFIEEIKIDPEFCKNWADLGPIYGKQWRSWERYDKIGQHYSSVTQKIEESSVLERMPIDQIANLIRDLKSNPDSRRLIVNSWNCSDLDSMVLPPCHYSFQVYTRELSESERFKWYTEKIGSGMHHDHIVQEMDEAGVPKRAISLIWNQRSCDTFLGIPFNIASYGLLLEILGKICNMAPDELIGNLGDTHLYLNHLEQAREQISRSFYELPKLVHGKTDAFWKDFDVSLITHLDPSDFSLEGYISHPAIKAPLSN